jgi:FlaG/FlaF family flagellin (archaellin)
MLTKATLLAATCSAFLFGCTTEQPSSTDETQEIIDNLTQAGFPANDIMVVDGVVYTGRDAVVTLQASREMLESDAGKEQYRTTNLVSRSLAVICVNGSAFTGKFSSALDLAIGNYNALGLTFRMQRTTGSTTGCGATITARVSSGTGGSSGFPSGGRPFNTINIGSGLNSTTFSVDTVEHVITHELGHTVGFRHSDFFNRSISCGGAATNEGDGGVGAILIQGTPSGATVGGSIMNSCFRTVETGEFTSSDITALQVLY